MASVTKRPWTYNGITKTAWAVRYFDPATGKRPSKQFETKKEADAFKRKVEREVEDGTHVGPSASLSVAQVGALYLEDVGRRQQRGEIAEVTVRDVTRFLNKHIHPAIGGILFKDLTAADVDRLYERLCGTLKPVGARKVLSYLGSMEKFANRHRYLLTNPVMAALAGIRRPKASRIREFTLDEIKTILSTSPVREIGKDARAVAMLACFIHIAGCCGLRIGELCGLKLEHVDLDRGRIAVRHSLNKLGEIVAPKTEAGYREVPIPNHVREMVASWLAEHYRENDHGLLFTSRKKRPINSTNLLKSWQRLLVRCGMGNAGDDFHFHALRHFAGSWWLHNGMPIMDVSKLLGHANPAVTLQIYAHVLSTDDQRHSAVATLGRKLLELPDARETQAA